MKDTDLYRQILGITPPWDVARVDLDAKALRIDVTLEHATGKRWACPECGELCGLHDHADERRDRVDTSRTGDEHPKRHRTRHARERASGVDVAHDPAVVIAVDGIEPRS